MSLLFNMLSRLVIWRRKWQPTPVFLPGKFHGQRSLVGYNPWGRRESDTTKLLQTTTTRLVITFLPRTKHHLISWLQSPSAVILEPPKIKSLTVSMVSPSICHEVMGPDALILLFWMLSFKPTFSLFSFHFHQGALYFVDMDKMVLKSYRQGKEPELTTRYRRTTKDRGLMPPNFKTYHKIP